RHHGAHGPQGPRGGNQGGRATKEDPALPRRVRLRHLADRGTAAPRARPVSAATSAATPPPSVLIAERGIALDNEERAQRRQSPVTTSSSTRTRPRPWPSRSTASSTLPRRSSRPLSAPI